MECYESHETIKVGDCVRYLPTGTIFIVKDIYCDSVVGEFKLPAGLRKYRRAVIIPANDSGHYPVSDDIAKICPKCGKEIPQRDYIDMESDDVWKEKAIQRDMIATMKKLGKGKKRNVSIVLLYKIKSLGEDKRLKIEMGAGMYEWLAKCGINFDDFSKGEKLFDDDREKFMDWIKAMKAKVEIVDKNFAYNLLFGEQKDAMNR